ncbi:hypothetical protein E2C01_016091 [Portunus trituberculatus]|uniref:Uncharacterized protein n=1 Tax=Portunus trituberculatus TaxID=210409 RepID=A0A5B7DQ10_PORTR|nr:hypothetical protein [Portunus trituberculatus]
MRRRLGTHRLDASGKQATHAAAALRCSTGRKTSRWCKFEALRLSADLKSSHTELKQPSTSVPPSDNSPCMEYSSFYCIKKKKKECYVCLRIQPVTNLFILQDSDLHDTHRLYKTFKTVISMPNGRLEVITSNPANEDLSLADNLW